MNDIIDIYAYDRSLIVTHSTQFRYVLDWIHAQLRDLLLSYTVNTPQNESFAFDLNSNLINLIEQSRLKFLVLLRTFLYLLQLQSRHPKQLFRHRVIHRHPNGPRVVTELNIGVVFVRHDIVFALKTFDWIYVDFLLAKVTEFEYDFLLLNSQKMGAKYIYLYLMVCTFVLYLSSCWISYMHWMLMGFAYSWF